MTHYEFIRKSDQVIIWRFADNETLDSSPVVYINDATVTANLYDESGDLVSGFPVSLSYVSDSDGEYRGVLSSTGPESPSGEFDPPLGFTYRLEIVVETPGGVNLTKIYPARVVE